MTTANTVTDNAATRGQAPVQYGSQGAAPTYAFPGSPHSAYSNSPNTPLTFNHLSPHVANAALDATGIISSQPSFVGAPEQSPYTPHTAAPFGSPPKPFSASQAAQMAMLNSGHRRSSSAGSAASISDALGLQTSAGGSGQYVGASGMQMGSGTNDMFPGAPIPIARRSSVASIAHSRRGSLVYNAGSGSQHQQRSPYQSNGLPISVEPQHPPLPSLAAAATSPAMAHAHAHSNSVSPHLSASPPTLPPLPSSTPPMSASAGLADSTSPRLGSIIIRTKATRKPKKMLPTPEPGLSKASRGRAVPTRIELQPTGVWDGDISAAHSRARIKERVAGRRSTRAALAADDDFEELSPPPPPPQQLQPVMSPTPPPPLPLPMLNTAKAQEAMPPVQVVSPRSYVCPVDSCNKAFKRREHLRCADLLSTQRGR